jgi:hypothetical protein
MALHKEFRKKILLLYEGSGKSVLPERQSSELSQLNAAGRKFCDQTGQSIHDQKEN